MDIKIEKKPWYIRYKYYLAGGVVFMAFLIYVITLSAGPRKLRIDAGKLQIVEVVDGKFMEYVDVEGVVQPILTKNRYLATRKPAARFGGNGDPQKSNQQ